MSSGILLESKSDDVKIVTFWCDDSWEYWLTLNDLPSKSRYQVTVYGDGYREEDKWFETEKEAISFHGMMCTKYNATTEVKLTGGLMPKTIKTPGVKDLMLNILLMEDEVDGKGNTKQRDSFKKEYYKEINKFRKEVVDGVENGLVSKEAKQEELTDKDIEWVGNKDFVLPEGKKMLMQRHTDKEVEVSDLLLKAVKDYYEQRETLPKGLSDAVLGEFEELIK